MNTREMLVSTTSSVEGWDIEHYLGPVFSHIVAGTGFFSDFAAGLSDVFGGRSQTYQRQLSAINTEAIELLKTKASLMGGNLVLGFRIDHDEISGKAKQMFMVTASGTAVRAVQRSQSKNNRQNASFLTSDELEIALKKKLIIEKCKTIPVSLSEDEWAFAIENQIHEIAPLVLGSLQLILEQPVAQQEGYFDRRRRYFLSLPHEQSIPALYETLHHNDLLFPFVRDTVIQGDLFDFDSLFTLLRSGDFRLQKCALALATSNKQFFTVEDIERFSNLIELIRSLFVVRAKFIEEKSKLTSSVKHRWLCDCGGKNDKEDTICSKCQKDVYGFLGDETRPEPVIANIQSKIEVLENSFQGIEA